jgi:hypothetical protein
MCYEMLSAAFQAESKRCLAVFQAAFPHPAVASSIVGTKPFAREPVAAESPFEQVLRWLGVAPFRRACGGSVLDRRCQAREPVATESPFMHL